MKKNDWNASDAKTFGVLIACIIMLICGLVAFSPYKEKAYCEKCVRMEKSIRNLLIDIEIHDPDFVMDVLSETDDWLILEDLMGPINPPVIKDSTYRKLRNVFPDLPAEQAPQWK